jgi:CheY-like chemotaxis protein
MEPSSELRERLNRCAELNARMVVDDDPEIARAIINLADEGLALIAANTNARAFKILKAHRANALANLAQIEGPDARYWLLAAMVDCDTGLDVADEESDDVDGVLHKLKGTALLHMAEWAGEDQAQCYGDALVEFQLAVWGLDPEEATEEWSHAQHNLAEICYQLILLDAHDNQRLAKRGLEAISEAIRGWQSVHHGLEVARAEAVRGNLLNWLADARDVERAESLRAAAEAYLTCMELAAEAGDYDLCGLTAALYGEVCWKLSRLDEKARVHPLKAAYYGLHEALRCVALDDRVMSWSAIRFLQSQVAAELVPLLPKSAGELRLEAVRAGWGAWSALAYSCYDETEQAQAAQAGLQTLREAFGADFEIAWDQAEIGEPPSWLAV